MTDLDDRLHTGITALAERAQPSTSRSDVVTRLRHGSKHSRKIGLRVAVAAAVVLVIVAGVALVRRDENQAVVDSGPSSTTRNDLPDWKPTTLAPGWHDLPAGPLGAISPRAMVWTGSELVIWRSEDARMANLNRAASFAPATNEWTELPPDPLVTTTPEPVVDPFGDPLNAGVGGAWTGDEALFWTPVGVVAWNPSTASWRSAAPSPNPRERDGVWTGSEVVFWADGLAYDPFDDTWREITRPSDLLVGSVNDDAEGLLWTGAQVVVVGGLSGAYEPATDTWREFGAPLTEESGSLGILWDGFTATVTQIDGQITAFDYSPSSAAVLDLGAGAWSERIDLTPQIDPSGWLQAATFDDGRTLFVGTDDAKLRSTDGSWSSAYLPPSIGELAATGDAAFLYGMRGDRARFSVFVPPVVVPASWDASSLGQGWHMLDRGPLPAGSPYVMVTGPSQLFLYGFSTPEDTVENIGYLYTPATGEWSDVPASPLTSTQALGGAWTGEEFVVWSTSGVAFWDPENERWRDGAAPSRA